MPRMSLKTLQNSRRSYCQILRAYRFKTDESLEGGRFRDLVYAFSVLLSFFKAEQAEDLERRISELEKLVTEGGYKHAQKPN